MARVVTALNSAIGKGVTGGKVALITGGTSRIGAATARCVAELGAKVVVTVRRIYQAKQTSITVSQTNNSLWNTDQPQHSRGTDLAERVHLNQQKLASKIPRRYDYIVCGAGSSGSVAAGRGVRQPSRNGNVEAEQSERKTERDAPDPWEKQANELEWCLSRSSMRRSVDVKENALP